MGTVVHLPGRADPDWQAQVLAASLVESVTDKPAEIDVDTWESWQKKEQ